MSNNNYHLLFTTSQLNSFSQIPSFPISQLPSFCHVWRVKIEVEVKVKVEEKKRGQD